MTFRWRVCSGLALVLTMLGSPMASVLCALACPDVGEPAHAAAVPARPVLASGDAPPCHEAAAAAGAPSRHAARPLPAQGHRCDPPAIVSAPRGPEGLRVPQPTMVALYVLHVSSHLPTSAVHASSHPASPPARSRGPAVSPVLRI